MCQLCLSLSLCFFFFQAEDGIRDVAVTGVQTCALPIYGFDHVFRTGAVARFQIGGHRDGYGASDSSGDFQHLLARKPRSEERRVGEECRTRWWPYHLKKKKERERVSNDIQQTNKYGNT